MLPFGVINDDSERNVVRSLKSGGRIVASARNEAPKAPRVVVCELGVSPSPSGKGLVG